MSKNTYDENKLLEKAFLGDLDGVKAIFDRGVNIDVKDKDGCTPLILAAASDSKNAFEMVKYIISCGADRSMLDKYKYSKLPKVAKSKNVHALDILKYLVGYGVDVNAQDEWGATVLMEAVESEYPSSYEMVEYLLSLNAKRKRVEIDALDMFENTALMRVAKSKNPQALEIVRLLLAHGANVAVHDTLSSVALCNNPHALAIAELFIARGATVDSFALVTAAGSNDVQTFQMVKMFLEHGQKFAGQTVTDLHGTHPVFDVNARFSGGHTALIRAAMKDSLKNDKENLAVVKLLVEYGADIHSKDEKGFTPLTQAVFCENADVAEYLFSQDDFLPSDLMPRPDIVGYSPTDVALRKKVIPKITERIESGNLDDAQKIAEDIAAIARSTQPSPTGDDVKIVKTIADKLASMDWMNGAQVTSDDFLVR